LAPFYARTCRKISEALAQVVNLQTHAETADDNYSNAGQICTLTTIEMRLCAGGSQRNITTALARTNPKTCCTFGSETLGRGNVGGPAGHLLSI